MSFKDGTMPFVMTKKAITNIRYSARLNSFRVSAKPKATVLDLISLASRVKGLTHVDLNYPEHFENVTPSEIKESLFKSKLKLNSIQMRFNKNPIFSYQALSSKNRVVRKKAIKEAQKAIYLLIFFGCDLLTIWPSQEGYDYAFEIDYQIAYKNLINSIKIISLYDKKIRVSIEFKPNDPHAFSLISNTSSAIMLASDTGLRNVGLTLDFCHLLISRESPAASVSMALMKNRMFGVHLNDGYGINDDGLMVASVHPIQTAEFLWVLFNGGYKGVIYFDTFPNDIDPVVECEQNIHTVNSLIKEINQMKSGDILSPLCFRNLIF